MRSTQVRTELLREQPHRKPGPVRLIWNEPRVGSASSPPVFSNGNLQLISVYPWGRLTSQTETVSLFQTREERGKKNSLPGPPISHQKLTCVCR